ncbi:hypothetical protein K523DRAFT_133932 [Schizophyllum commune Tattone D]|nr:hypothetical protein K523DRAFT_133932 [Schizophyllum commune Tattone D]
MKLGDVAVLIAKHNRRPYLLAGVGKLKAYLEVGERHGVVQRVGPKTTYLMGHVALADKYRPLGRPSPPPFVMTHSRRSSDTTVVSDSVEQASELAEKPHSYVGSDSGFEEESGAEMTAPVSVSVKAETPVCPAQSEPAPVDPPKVDEVVSAPPSEPDSVVVDESAETDIASQAPSIPSGFDVLVRVLQEVGPGGEYRMKRLDLAELMSAKHGRMPYVQAGVGKFSRYLELAVSLGIVEVEGKIVGGRKAKTAVVILREAYRASPIASPSVSPMPSEESEAPAPTPVPEAEQAPSIEEHASLETEAPVATFEAAELTATEEVTAEECTTCESPATVVNEPLAADTQEVPLAVKTTPFSEQSSWAFELISPNPPEIEIDFSCTESLEALVANSNTFMTFDKPSVTDIDEEDTAAAAETHISAPQSFVSDISSIDVADPTPSPPPSATAGDIDVLIEVLHSHLDKGFTEPLRSIVDFDLRYRLGWEGNLNGLFLQAEAAGLIRTGVHRYSGLEWVALAPTY